MKRRACALKRYGTQAWQFLEIASPAVAGSQWHFEDVTFLTRTSPLSVLSFYGRLTGQRRENFTDRGIEGAAPLSHFATVRFSFPLSPRRSNFFLTPIYRNIKRFYSEGLVLFLLFLQRWKHRRRFDRIAFTSFELKQVVDGMGTPSLIKPPSTFPNEKEAFPAGHQREAKGL